MASGAGAAAVCGAFIGAGHPSNNLATLARFVLPFVLRMVVDDTHFPRLGLSPVYAPTLRAHMNETIATLREVVLMPRDIPLVVPRTVRPREDVVVLVHGFFASAGVFRPMKRHLLATGAQVASFTHAPGAGVERIARRLARLIDKLPAECRIHLVGHSLGGLVARWYVQELGGHARVAQTISLGSPFGGTERAKRFPFLVGADLHRSSPLLARLRQRAHDHDVPHTSIVADHDRVVVPCESSVFPRGDVYVLHGRGHNTLLFDAESIARVVAQVRRVQKAVDLEALAVSGKSDHAS